MDAASRWRLVRLSWALVAAVLPAELAHVAASGGQPEQQAARRLWVLRAPDSIIEYDAATLAATRTLTIPRRAFDAPGRLAVGSRGQMLLAPPENLGDGRSSGSTDAGPWIWDGRRARQLTAGDSATACGDATTVPPGTQTTRRWFLSASGESLFCFESRFEYRADKGRATSAPLQSVRSTARLWRSPLDGGRAEPVASMDSGGWCTCETGACDETCAEWDLWAPDGVIGSFFLLTRLTPGQLETTWHESFLYRRLARGWKAARLPRPVARPLASSATGEVMIVADPDGGCCGWENESSDRLLVQRTGEPSVLYDEFARYRNADYDVSFFPSAARIAPGGRLLAYTLGSTARPGLPIRLSSSGNENAEERSRVVAAIGGLPGVEIVALEGSARHPAVIPHAELVGWLSDSELLLVRGGLLAVSDTHGRIVRTTDLRVRGASDAFLR